MIEDDGKQDKVGGCCKQRHEHCGAGRMTEDDGTQDKVDGCCEQRNEHCGAGRMTGDDGKQLSIIPNNRTSMNEQEREAAQ